jgi:hypothetical protein
MAGKDLEYSSILRNSLQLIKKNPLLFAPNILMILSSLLLILLFFHGSGLFDLLTTKTYVLADKTALFEELTALSGKARFTFSGLAWIIGELVIGAFFLVAKFGMIRSVVKREKITIKKTLAFVETHYFNYWFIHFISTAIIFGPLFIIFFIYFLFIANNLAFIEIAPFIMGAFAIIWAVYAFWMWMRLLFVYPVMSFEKDEFFKSIKDEFHYVKTHVLHSLMSYLIFLSFGVGIWLVDKSINVIGVYISGQAVIITITLLMIFFEIFLTTWEHVFIFKSYEAGKHINKLVAKAVKSGSYVPKAKSKKSISKQKK